MGSFVTLAATERYLKGVSQVEASSQRGLTAGELTEAERLGEAWVRSQLSGVFDMAAWVNSTATPTLVRAAADLRASAHARYWYFKKEPTGKNKNDHRELFEMSAELMKDILAAQTLFLDNGTPVTRIAGSGVMTGAVAVAQERPLFPAERLERWRQEHELSHERQSFLEGQDTFNP